MNEKIYCNNNSHPICKNNSCPINKDQLYYTTTRISVTISDVNMTIAIPCLLCDQIEKIDMSKILNKAYTKELLKE